MNNPHRRISDFKILRVIGAGTFGKVYLTLLNERPVALKALKKTQVIMQQQVDHVKQEKNLLAEIQNPFIV